MLLLDLVAPRADSARLRWTRRVAGAVVAWLLVMAPAARAAIPIEHWVQPSGVQVYLVPSHGIPMVDVQIDFDAGARRDPRDKAGLASVTAGMASRGIRAGAGDTPADRGLDENALGEAWADLGASLRTSAGDDRMSFALRSLTYPDLLPRVVALAARQLARPAFPEDVWQRQRAQLAASIRESLTRPATVASHAFSDAVYGAHPYGYRTTETSLANIGVADMHALYRRLIRPCRAKVSIVGDVTRAQADDMVRRLFALFEPDAACPALPAVPAVAPLREAIRVDVPFESAQAHVLIGQPGIRRNDPDFLALVVGNYVLGGGGFVSRLYEEVREKRGLSYSVYSYFAPGLHEGAFTVGLQTRPDQAAEAVAVSRDVVARFVREGPTDKELQAAKDNLIGGFALRIDSNRKLLDNVSNIAWNGLPLDYLDTWTQRVDRLTVADVKAAFARVLRPDAMVTVVLGGRAP